MPSVLWCCWLGSRKGIRPVKTEWWGTGIVICLERGADLHIAQLMPLPLTVSCFSKIQIGFTFLVSAYLGSPGQGPLNGCVRVCDLFSCIAASLFNKLTYLLNNENFTDYLIYNKSASSFLRRLTTRHCPHLLLQLSAGPPAVQQSIDISWPPGPQQQTRSSLSNGTFSGWIY